ncbi:MAG: hypothetical protein LUE20_10890 [Oscillospiraceae bacterium]|nr:hypothetical protein [Oscillospiraceae bacterium]
MSEYKGIDVSKYQSPGKMDYGALKDLGYSFVIAKAGSLKGKDSAFDTHYTKARAAGLSVGAYLYSYATTEEEASEEAELMLSWIKGKKLTHPIVYDIEDGTQKALGKAKCTAIALKFLTEIEDAGCYAMLYSYANFIKNYLDMDKLRHFDVWLACYTSSERRKALYTHPVLGIWQYSSSEVLGDVYPSRLDQDVAYKDYKKIIEGKGLNVVRNS